jgi:hypothetical protein
MVQLVAFSQSGAVQHELDTPDRPIELNFQYLNLSDPFSSRSPYSFKFPMPISKVNSKFFSFFYNANVADGTFNALTKTDCTLYVDGIAVMEGVLQMHSVSPKGFEVSILEQVADVFDFINDLTFPQLFTTEAGTLDTDLDHALSWGNVRDSWVTTNDITTGAVGAGTIVYPLSDCAQADGSNVQQYGTGGGFYYSAQYGMQDLNLSVLNFKPAIRIAYLVRYIFERAGYAVRSSFLDSADVQKMYMFLATETERVQGRINYGFLVGLTTAFTIETAQASLMLPLAFTQESVSPFFDPDGMITGGAFIAPYDGTFTLKTRIVVTAGAAALGTSYSLTTQLTVNGESTVPNQAIDFLAYTETHIVDNEFTLTLNASDSVAVYVATTNTLADATINLTGANTATYFKLVDYTTTSTFVDVSQNFPDVSVSDWLKAIVQKFNLVMVSDSATPKVIEIEPFSDWWSSGTANKDWTEIVDQDSIKIEPTTKLQKKKYEFTDAEGKDHQNTWWQLTYGWIKGRYTYLNENDFVSGDEKTSEVFQPYCNRPIFQTTSNINGTIIPNVLVPIFWEWDSGSDFPYAKKWVSCKPVLAYYNGLQDIGTATQTFQFGGVDYTTYPYFSEYNEVGVSLTTKSLAWGYDHPTSFDAPFISGGNTAGTTLRYLFYEYWSQQFNEIYSPESRIMTCKVNLNYTELYDLKFNDNLYLDGCYWRVLSIDNFQVGGNGLANATLLKVIAKPLGRESSNCNARPSSFNTDGTVNFVSNSTGDPVSVTEPCCTLHGYVWDDDNNQCFSRTAGGGHGGGGTGSGDGSDGGAGGGGNGGGGVGGETPQKQFPAEVPNPYVSFPLSKIDTFQQGGVIGANIKTNLYQTTTGATPTKASTSAGLTDWTIPLDSVVYVKISAVAVEVSGSAATIGESVTQNVQATVANTRTGARSQIVARDVGSTTVIAENKDAGASATISVDAYQARTGDSSSFSLTCTGATNINMAWFIDMELTTIQIAGGSETLGRPIVYNLDPNIIEYANLSPSTILDFNLPLL